MIKFIWKWFWIIVWGPPSKKKPEHQHEWGKWDRFGVTMQHRYCTSCGLEQIRT